MTPQQIHDLLQAALAVSIVDDCAEGFSDLNLTPQFAQCLKRLLVDDEYREIALAAWQEMAASPESRAKAYQYLRETFRCQQLPESRSASDTADTPLISKN